MRDPDFIKLPASPEPQDPHERGVRIIYVLLAVLTVVLVYGFCTSGRS